MTTRHCHCARNPSGKDKLYPEEIREIAERHFSKVKQRPCPIELDFRKSGSRYDELIAVWTRYWNDVFKPSQPLDPNLVKALIATESLSNEKGELKDHFLVFTREELDDPSNNICAGTRWLFQKHRLASGKLVRIATWEEAVAEYKSLTKDLKSRKSRPITLLNRFKAKLEQLNSCKGK